MIKIKLKNPYNSSLINKIKIEKEIIEETGEIFYRATLNREFVADVITSKGKNFIVDIYIDKKYRRNGIATFLYNYVKKDLGIKLEPSGGKELKSHSFDGKKFWINRLIREKK